MIWDMVGHERDDPNFAKFCKGHSRRVHEIATASHLKLLYDCDALLLGQTVTSALTFTRIPAKFQANIIIFGIGRVKRKLPDDATSAR